VFLVVDRGDATAHEAESLFLQPLLSQLALPSLFLRHLLRWPLVLSEDWLVCFVFVDSSVDDRLEGRREGVFEDGLSRVVVDLVLLWDYVIPVLSCTISSLRNLLYFLARLRRSPRTLFFLSSLIFMNSTVPSFL